jgi:3-isopropylmalate/(R)-2-methylmalate dehydratase small subunit
VLAASFSRTYFRNAINNGLLPVICDTRDIHEGDKIVVTGNNEDTIGMKIKNETTGKEIAAGSLPQIMLDILEAGGLVPYFRQHGEFRV